MKTLQSEIYFNTQVVSWNKKSLDDLGIQSLQSDEGRKIINIKAGDQAIRTAYDIEIFTNTLINIAKSLIL